jgi:hypothetical protein
VPLRLQINAAGAAHATRAVTNYSSTTQPDKSFQV